MRKAGETFGAMRQGNQFLIARVENDGIRPLVTALLAEQDALEKVSFNGSRLFFGVDEQAAIIKKIQLKKVSPTDMAALVRFEMIQSLLEPASDFYFDSRPINDWEGYRRFIAIAYHRHHIDQEIAVCGDRLRQPSGFKLNALALSDGFLTFCRLDPGDLQILLNVDPLRAVIAILYRRKLHSIGRLDTIPGETITAESARRLSQELKVVISYHLAELFREGVTIPLSRIILSGQHARESTLTTALKETISTEIGLPHFQAGYFQSVADIIEHGQPERFLIPLGLALE